MAATKHIELDFISGVPGVCLVFGMDGWMDRWMTSAWALQVCGTWGSAENETAKRGIPLVLAQGICAFYFEHLTC